MIGLGLAALAGTGVHLVYTAVVTGERRLFPRGSGGLRSVETWWRARARSRPGPTGLVGVRRRDLVVMGLTAGLIGGSAGFLVFGAELPAAAVGLCAGLWPPAALRMRRAQVRTQAQDAWPRLIAEMQILIGHVGRSVPQALFEVGARAPEGLRPAFEAAHREWLLTTDFERTLTVLKGQLADPTADAVCETLLVAHEVGGTDVDRRLEALVEDRTLDVQGRKDARSRQSGVVFARRFVLLVPCGLGLVGMSIGTGRQAYATPWGQTMVMLGILTVVGCWMWAGRLLRLPEERRVFAAEAAAGAGR